MEVLFYDRCLCGIGTCHHYFSCGQCRELDPGHPFTVSIGRIIYADT